MYFKQLTITAFLLMNAVVSTTTAAFLERGDGRRLEQDNLVGHHRRRLLLEEGMNHRLVNEFAATFAARVSWTPLLLDQMALTDCQEMRQEMQYAVSRVEMNSPQVYIAEDTGETNYYYFLYDPANTSGEATGLFLDMPSQTVEFDGVCYKSGVYAFGDINGENPDMVMTFEPCDGSGFGDFDQMILSGSGAYECASGDVTRIEENASGAANDGYVLFEFSICKDAADCAPV